MAAPERVKATEKQMYLRCRAGTTCILQQMKETKDVRSLDEASSRERANRKREGKRSGNGERTAIWGIFGENERDLN